MKRLPALFLAVVLAWALAPGVGEVVENAFHLLTSGHLAHASVPEHGEGGHHAPGPEHGCGGAVHLCSCCTSLAAAPPQARVALIAAPVWHRLGPAGDPLVPNEIVRSFEHPPRLRG